MSDAESTIAELRDVEDLPEADGELTFSAPWQARAFAVVVTLYREGLFEWNEFQARLIEAIEERGAAGEDAYYRCWVTAAERLLAQKGLCSGDELRERTEAFAAGERDASEFVVGVEHAHSHDHGPDQDSGGGHGRGRGGDGSGR